MKIHTITKNTIVIYLFWVTAASAAVAAAAATAAATATGATIIVN